MMKRKIVATFALLTTLLCCNTANADTPAWSANNNFKYSMRAYLSVVLNDKQIDDVSSFDIYAFYADDKDHKVCRGVSEITKLTDSKNVAYIAIGDSINPGSDVVFCLYHKTTGKYIYDIIPQGMDKVTFNDNTSTDQGTLGTPSAPKLFSIKYGDVNNDGNINIVDVAQLVTIVKGDKPETMASDVNSDGKTDLKDISALANMLIEKK